MAKEYTNRRIQRNVIISYILTGLILIGVLSYAYSRIITSQIVESNYMFQKSALRVSVRSVNAMLEEVYSRYFQLFNTSPEIAGFLSDNYDELTLQRYISNVAVSDYLVDSVYIVDNISQKIYTSYNRDVDLNLSQYSDIRDMIRDLNQTNSSIRTLVFYPRRTFIENLEKDYLTLTFAQRDIEGRFSKTMFVNIDVITLSEFLDYQAGSSYMLIVNRFGQVIADSSDRYFLKNYYANERQVAQQSNVESDDVYLAEVFENKSQVVYDISERFQLTYISISQYSVILNEVNQNNRLILTIFAFFLAVSGMISLFMTRKIVDPIQNIIEQFARINQLPPNQQLDEFQFIANALDELDQKEMSLLMKKAFSGQHIDQLELDFSYQHYVIVIYPVLVDIRKKVKESSIRTLLDHLKPYVTPVDDHGFSALIRADLLDDLLKEQLSEWIVGISYAFNKSEMISKSFKQAKAAAEYAMTVPGSKVQYYKNIVSSEVEDHRLQIKEQLHTYIQTNFSRKEASISLLAQELGYSIGYARQLFKEEIGVPFNDYLIQIRIDHACRLLEETELSTKEIAESIGIEDVRYFYTIFKNRTGKTAQQYRKEHADHGRNT